MGIFYKRYTEAWRVEFGLEEIFHRMVSKPLPPLTTNHCVSCYVCSFSTALVVQSASRNCRPLVQAPVVRLSIHRYPPLPLPRICLLDLRLPNSLISPPTCPLPKSAKAVKVSSARKQRTKGWFPVLRTTRDNGTCQNKKKNIHAVSAWISVWRADETCHGSKS